MTPPPPLPGTDGFPAPERAVSRPLRLFVQDVFKGQQQSALSMAGRIDAGMMQAADRVTVMPHGETATVKGGASNAAAGRTGVIVHTGRERRVLLILVDLSELSLVMSSCMGQCLVMLRSISNYLLILRGYYREGNWL